MAGGDIDRSGSEVLTSDELEGEMEKSVQRSSGDEAMAQITARSKYENETPWWQQAIDTERAARVGGVDMLTMGMGQGISKQAYDILLGKQLSNEIIGLEQQATEMHPWAHMSGELGGAIAGAAVGTPGTALGETGAAGIARIGGGKAAQVIGRTALEGAADLGLYSAGSSVGDDLLKDREVDISRAASQGVKGAILGLVGGAVLGTAAHGIGRGIGGVARAVTKPSLEATEKFTSAVAKTEADYAKSLEVAAGKQARADATYAKRVGRAQSRIDKLQSDLASLEGSAHGARFAEAEQAARATRAKAAQAEIEAIRGGAKNDMPPDLAASLEIATGQPSAGIKDAKAALRGTRSELQKAEAQAIIELRKEAEGFKHISPRGGKQQRAFRGLLRSEAIKGFERAGVPLPPVLAASKRTEIGALAAAARDMTPAQRKIVYDLLRDEMWGGLGVMNSVENLEKLQNHMGNVSQAELMLKAHESGLKSLNKEQKIALKAAQKEFKAATAMSSSYGSKAERDLVAAKALSDEVAKQRELMGEIRRPTVEMPERPEMPTRDQFAPGKTPTSDTSHSTHAAAVTTIASGGNIGIAAKYMMARELMGAVRDKVTSVIDGVLKNKSAAEILNMSSSIQAFTERTLIGVVRNGTRTGLAVYKQPTREDYDKLERAVSDSHRKITSDQQYVRDVMESMGGDSRVQMAGYEATKKAADNLMQRMPKNRWDAASTGFPIAIPKSKVLSEDERKFFRYAETTLDPLTALEHLEHGSLSRENVDALKDNHKQIYDDIIQSLMQEVSIASEDGANIDYNSTIQLSILLGAPLHPTMRPEFIKTVQEALAVEEQPKQPQGAPQPDKRTFRDSIHNTVSEESESL